ncbi:response regulator [Henriciella marina]|uniref:response regulator n=1 Tax=Henriciella marina TaxID=453851 RepID=UPI0003787BA9|nr:response regulator [Henriciella marina]
MARELNVLVVDDDPIDQRLLSSALRKCSDDIRIRTADGGLEALDAFSKDDLPDLVVTDIKMPGIDGHQLVDLIRGTPRYCCIPVVAYSTSMDEQDVRNAYMEGANAYIVKPSSQADYLEVGRAIVDFWTKTAELPRLS